MKKRKSFLIVLFCAGVVLIVVAAVFLPRKPSFVYRVTFLPTLGGFQTNPQAINDRGQVIGVADTAAGASYAFLWDKEKGFRTIERFDEPPHSGALSLNNAGQIVGTMADPNANQRAFLWDLNAGRQLLGTLGGKQSAADNLNNRGQVVGSSEIPTRHRHAFVWDAITGMKDLGTLGGLISGAASINDSGQIVGFAEAADRHNHIVVWDPIPQTEENKQDTEHRNPSMPSPPPGYRRIDLGDAGVGPFVCEINNNGMVIWRVSTTSGKTYFMTWTQATGSRRLNFVRDSGMPIGLNERNQFLIRAKPTGLKMFGRVLRRCHQCYLWDPNTGPLLLESHLPVKDIVYFSIREINNEGQIIAVLRTKNSNQILAVLLEKEGR